METVTQAPSTLPPEDRAFSRREKLDLTIIVGTLGGAAVGEFALPDS